MRDTDLETVLRLVEENAKQRFEVLYGYDPSPPRPRAKGQGKGKGKFKAKLGVRQGSIYGEVDAAAIDGVRNDLAQVAITSERPECAELPLVTIPLPVSDEAESFEGQRGKYFIRAIQGHSLKLESTAHLTPVLDDEDGRGRAGLIVHGTQWELWETLSASLQRFLYSC